MLLNRLLVQYQSCEALNAAEQTMLKDFRNVNLNAAEQTFCRMIAELLSP